jgi:type VI secretion system protein ImpE
MNSHQLYHAGQLKQAVTAALSEVQKKPADMNVRGFLCELLCLAGDLERADKHLEVIAQQDPKLAVNVALLRQLVRAETARQQFFSEGRVPEFLDEPTPILKEHLRASVALREGRGDEAARILAEIADTAPPVSGTCDEKPFDIFVDEDDLTARFFEVLTSTGKYYWVPFERVESIDFRAPERPRDLLWRRALMVCRGGPDGEVYLPAIYCGTSTADDDGLRLGRSTIWQGGGGAPVRGLGQRMFLVGDDERPILEIKQLTFGAA